MRIFYDRLRVPYRNRIVILYHTTESAGISFLSKNVGCSRMSFLARSRPVQLAVSLLALILVVYFLFFSKKGDDAYSPEQINDMFQNKDRDVLVKKVELRNLELLPPYLEKTTLKSANWQWAGDIIYKNDEYVRLTSARQHQVGNMFSKMPIQAESFEMELTFHIHSESKASLVADGLAIWIVDKPSPIGEVFGAANRFNGLGIFIDTYKNGAKRKFPYINVMLGDGQTRYDKSIDGVDTELAGCTAHSLLNPLSGQSRMRLIYTRNGYLSVDFNYNPHFSDDWHNCFTLTDIKLPPVKYLGFSAETGDLTENVDLITNKVFALFNPENEEFVDSVELLENMIKEEPNKGSPSRNQHKKRKSLVRLKKSEERIKQAARQRRLEKYGDPEATFVRRWIRRFLTFLKLIIYASIFALIVWVAAIIYRVQKQKKKSRIGGLLD